MSNIENEIALLFAEKPELIGSPVSVIQENLKGKYTYRQIAAVYEPIIEFEAADFDDFEDEDYYDGY